MSDDSPTSDPVAFPRLTAANHRVTSPANRRYNCIAWAAQDTTQWWQPGIPKRCYWPIPADEKADTTYDLKQALEAVGFVTCETGEFEPGYEKIALYETPFGKYTHAARQLTTRKWTSKLGRFVDIEHETPDDVAGGAHGTIAGYMKRPLPAA